MKFSLSRLALTALLAFAGGSLFAQKGVDLESELPPDAHHLKIGDAAPDFSLKGVDGKIYSLADFKDAPVLMVVFLSDHCPYSHAAETRLLPLVAEMKPRGLGVVAIMPNNPESMSIGELGYTKYGDSYDDMKLYAKEQGFTFPYLYDGDTQTTSEGLRLPLHAGSISFRPRPQAALHGPFRRFAFCRNQHRSLD